MNGKICFFIGHRDAPDSLLSILDVEIERHIIEYGVTDFVVGQYGHFDSMATHCVKAAKKRHPEVTLTLLLPYHPYDRPTPTPSGFCGTFYPPRMEKVPKNAAIIRANQYIANHSDYLIAYAWHLCSNARNLVEYALNQQAKGLINVVNLEHCI